MRKLIPDKKTFDDKEVECDILDQEMQRLKDEEEKRLRESKEVGLHCTLLDEVVVEMNNKFKDQITDLQ